MNVRHFVCLVVLFFSAAIVASCASRASSKLVDRKRGVYEVSIENFSDCGGIWHGKNMCIENVRPQIVGLSADICGKRPHAIHSCDEREARDGGREVYCLVECNAAPKVQQSTIQKARICQERGGIWIDNRCEVDLSN